MTNRVVRWLAKWVEQDEKRDIQMYADLKWDRYESSAKTILWIAVAFCFGAAWVMLDIMGLYELSYYAFWIAGFALFYGVVIRIVGAYLIHKHLCWLKRKRGIE